MKFSHVLVLLFLVSLLTPSIQFPAFSTGNPASSIEHLTYRFEVSKDLADHKGSVHTVAFSSDGNLVASGSEDTNVKLWEAESGKQVKAIMRHPFPVTCVAFNPDNSIVAAGLAAGTITLWDANYKERIKTLKGHQDRVLSICFSSGGATLISGSADKIIRFWDMSSGDSTRWLVGHTGAVNSLALSGKTLASGSEDGTIRIWNIDSKENTAKLEESTGAVNSVCFSPDGRLLAAGSASGAIRLWNLETGQEAGIFEGHKSAIGIDRGLSFSPDGRILASGSADARILVWDVSSGRIIDELKAHKAAVNSVSFSPDGRRMVSADSDGILKLWKINVKETLKITLNADYQGWQNGILGLKADVLGMPDVVRFQYSLDDSTWLDIVEKREPPYSVDWNSRTSIPGVAKAVSLRVVAERITGATATDMAAGAFSVDNEPPKTEHNYDGLWHRGDFRIELSATDGEGTGVNIIGYRLNYGEGKNTTWNDQPLITEEGRNVLEYWSVDRMGNEEPHKVLSDVKLDKTAPIFFGWATAPDSLLEDVTGSLRVSVQVIDEGGSGLEGKIPQLGYHIGSDTSYDRYKNMSEASGKVWYYDIPEPPEGWAHYTGKAIYYRVACEDVAGNVGQSAERQDLIGSPKVPPTVKMTNAFREWERGTLTIEADASDTDGSVEKVQFDYSLDSISWTPIDTVDSQPYSVKWDTAEDVPEVKISVWVRVTATDDDGLQGEYITPRFAVDNQPPDTNHDYSGLWQKANFTVNLSASDGDGSGIASVMYKLNGGSEKDTSTNGQPAINKQGINTLEYWSTDLAGNVEEHKLLSAVKLDRFPPSFDAWEVKQDADVLRVQVKVTDPDSGIETPPQLAYHIGSDTNYSDYKDMQKAGQAWKYDIDISAISSRIVGKTLFCKVSVRDAVGNLAIKPWEHEITGKIDTVTTTVIESEPAKVEEKPDIKPVPVAVSEKKKASIVWSDLPAGTFKTGEKVRLQGYLRPEISKSTPVGLTVIAPDDIIYESQVATDPVGAFQFTLPLNIDGEWRVIADWKGDSEFEAVRSQVLRIKAASEKSIAAPGEAKKTGNFLKRNSLIIGLVFLYIIAIRLYRD